MDRVSRFLKTDYWRRIRMNEYLDDVLDELQEIPEDDRFDIIQLL